MKRNLQIDDSAQINTEIGERIASINNIGYFIYTNFSSTTIICTAVTAIVMMLAIAFLGEWYNTKLIALGAFLGLAIIVISIILLYNYSKKQYLVKCENGKTILVEGGFRRFRKYYVKGSRYVVKDGQAKKIKGKKIDDIKILFTAMKRNIIVKKVSEDKEVYSIKRDDNGDFFGTLPTKCGMMKFVDGKFKKGYYTSTATMNYTLYYKVVENDVKYSDIVPDCILDLLIKN